jgi:tRNA(fMet)-specific endonuclease VapC
VERLIVDTGVLIAIERGRQIDATLLPDDADIAIAAITASELMAGVELAGAQRRPARTATVNAILATFDVIAFDVDAARHHAALLAHARRTGRPRGAHDLQIAATARATTRMLITTDAHAFGDLPASTTASYLSASAYNAWAEAARVVSFHKSAYFDRRRAMRSSTPLSGGQAEPSTQIRWGTLLLIQP